MKPCICCNQSLPLSEYYAHPQMADGHLNKCKTCVRSAVAKHYRATLPKQREYERERTQRPERKARVREYQRISRARNPEKSYARQKAERAAKAGLISKTPCVACGDPKSQAHHHDYSKPLDVKWLCFVCHRKEHGQMGHAA